MFVNTGVLSYNDVRKFGMEVIMDEQKIFIDTIESLKVLAAANNNSLSKKDIEDAFDMPLNDEQKQMIFAYLAAGNIKVEDFSGDTGMFEKKESVEIEAGDGEEQHFLDMYRDELKELKTYSSAEILGLYRDFTAGKDTKEELIKAHLVPVTEWVKPLRDKGTSMSDLIGEANLCLITAVDDLKHEEFSSGEAVSEFLKDEVIEYVTIMVNSEDESLMVENVALDRVNELNETVNKLYSKYLRPVTIKEIAKEMNINEEEAENIIRICGNKIKNIDYLN